ncbi:MAG: hypothetical protein IJP75_12160 [Bacteroidaceae bacterium]|nr:hypothetical protein [Bacteroidaceae bacterium]
MREKEKFPEKVLADELFALSLQLLDFPPAPNTGGNKREMLYDKTYY